MKYLSVCSGIEAASVAWEPLGWEPVAFSEIEAFPSAVLAHHFPHVPNLGDMTKHETWNIEPGSIDLLVGGTPCQSFSVAGLRKGLHDPRGGLMLRFVEIAQRLRPRWVVWENVPGVLSSNGGRDFGALLGSLADLGYGWAYRVLDAQYVRTHRHPRAVPQRRRRVFVVGCAGDPASAAAVLFESQSVRRDSAARGKAREGAAGDVASSLGARGVRSHTELDGHGAYIPESVGCLSSKWAKGTGGPSGDEAYNLIAYRKSKRAQSVTDDESWVEAAVANTINAFDTGERDTHAVATPPVAFASNLGTRGGDIYDDGSSPTVRVGSGSGGGRPPAVATYSITPPSGQGADLQATETDVASGISAVTLGDGTDRGIRVVSSPVHEETCMLDEDCSCSAGDLPATVRRLTPAECESLQGFPRGYTAIPWRGRPAEDCPDGPRYRALGNSMATNCMEWVGQRIADVEARR